MKKRLLSFVIALAYLTALVMPASALVIDTYVDDMALEKYDLINELISLAGDAAQEGDYETAAKYEEELTALGVDIVAADTYEDACLAFDNLDAGIAIQSQIEKPDDTSAAHWYRYEYPRYYYPSKYKYYDAITLRVVSWDDTSDWLHIDKWVQPSSGTDIPYVSLAVATGTYVFAAYVSQGAALVGLGIQYTLYELLAEAIGALEGDVAQVGLSSYRCHYLADVSYIFTYVRESGTSDYYVLSGVEAIVDSQYQIYYSGKMIMTNGKVETTLDSELPVSKTIISNDKIDIFKSFDAFDQGRQYIGEIGSLYVEMNGENVFVVYINMPESPAVPFATGEDEVT